MAVVAECSFGSQGSQIELNSPAERHTWVGNDMLLLGFPASPAGTPWSRLAEDDRRTLARAAMTGDLRLKGQWTLLADDSGELVVLTDGHGTRPLFYRRSSDNVVIAEEIWPLLQGKPDLDLLGVADFLLVGHNLGERTAFAGVSHTEADAVLRVGSHETSACLLKPPPPLPAIGDSLEDAMDALEDRLVALYAPYADLERLLNTLSGGLDSRVLLALAVEQGYDTRAWTVAIVRRSQEERIARAVASALGVRQIVSYRQVEDLASDPPLFVRATSGQLSLEHMDAFGSFTDLLSEEGVLVSGIWGDVICGGGFLLPADTPVTEIEHVSSKSLVGGREPSELQRFLPGVPDWADRLQESVATAYALADRQPRRSDFIFMRNRTTRFNIWSLIAHRPQFDYVAPFIDDDLMQVCYGMPEVWQRASRAYRAVITRRWPTLAGIPWEKTGLPVWREPRRLSRRIRELRRWYSVGRPISFTHHKVVLAAHGPLMDAAYGSLTPFLAKVGIDVAGLCERYPDPTGSLRLRLATLYLVLQEAGVLPGSVGADGIA